MGFTSRFTKEPSGRLQILLPVPLLLVTVLALLTLTTVGVLAATGTTDSASAPGSTSSYTLEDIHDRLESGAAGSQSTFTEPVTAPGTGTMHTLNDIMLLAPSLDGSAASTSEVASGRTFWGLSGGEWGPQSGSAAIGSDITGSEGDPAIAIPDGFYTGRTATAVDSDLLAGNIRSGVEIFGVAGSIQSRFNDNGDGTITDNQTGYIWMKDAGCMGRDQWINVMGSDPNWIARLNGGEEFSCSEYTAGTYDDWVMPEVWELGSLMDTRESNPVLPSGHPFVNVRNDFYWTDTNYYHSGELDAYAIRMSDGYVYNHSAGSNASVEYVWPMRDPSP